MALSIEPAATRAVLSGHIAAVRDALARIPVESIERVVDIIMQAHERARHIYIVGNGGSASTATHFACDLGKATIIDGRARLRVTSLTDNIALVTAWANDASYERVFAEQLMNVLNAGDVVIAVSASGNSPNVLAAVDVARVLDAVTVGLVGFSGGRLQRSVDAAVHVAADDYGVVEDCHLVLEHAITDSVRSRLRA
ncbi:MAG: SIS domain-containing protein [Candidatus Dormibacteraeota bacterium]|nr:SIS domain-containing protein [Candidatus Dormibacteraeota bacterium]MBV9524379.1 SIS domain-containing protein [Candidatus Dormibacteraeota bacterium]